MPLAGRRINMVVVQQAIQLVYFYYHYQECFSMMVNNKEVKVALVDDHKLFRKGLAELINDFPGYAVMDDFDNGWEFQRKLAAETAPDIVLLDVNMPEMSGYEVALWLKEFYPQVKILALSMNSNEISAMLHGKIERTRYVAHAARYVYKTWVVADDGSAITVDELSATIQGGNGKVQKRVANASSLKKQEEVDENNSECKVASLVATAKKGNVSATIAVKLG